MTWLYYLLEANLYLIVFYGFYRLFLQNETFYNLNRYFLLGATLISFTLPILQIGLLKPSFDQVHSDYLQYTGAMPPPPMQPIATNIVEPPVTGMNWINIIYLLVALGFALKLCFSIYRIMKMWINSRKHTAGDITLVEVNGESTAFSFFNLLFIHPSLASQPAVLKHEMVHIKQKHSFDVVFFELVQVICWFNPIIYFLKRDIKLLHEYIADELTTKADVQKHEYALFLIQNSFGLRSQAITNQIFNQSILKRRINMLNKKRTAAGARLRLLLTVPLTGAMLCVSTMAFTKEYGYVDLLPEKSELTISISQDPKVENIKKSNAPKVQNVKRDQVKFPPPIVKPDPPIFKPKYQEGYVVRYTIQYPSKNRVRLDKRYAVVNGTPVENQENFYGVMNSQSVTILNGEEATKRYGSKGKYGAVEITGSNNMTYFDEIVVPPPPREHTVHFRPPNGKFNMTYFTPTLRKDKVTGKLIGIDKRYIVINGKAVEDNTRFFGVTNIESVTFLNQTQATKVYDAEKVKYGAIEINGHNVKFNKEDDQIKFPPPPPVEPPPPGYKTKKDQIKFPPPIVKPDKPGKESGYKTKRDQIKFPPPTVKPDKKAMLTKEIEIKLSERPKLAEVVIIGDPTVEPTKEKQLEVVILKLHKEISNIEAEIRELRKSKTEKNDELLQNAREKQLELQMELAVLNSKKAN